LKLYHDSAEDDDAYQDYLERFVYGVRDLAGYLEAIGGADRLASLVADPEFGYRPDLRRRRLA
jgi:glutaconate CoA-transferase subunit A